MSLKSVLRSCETYCQERRTGVKAEECRIGCRWMHYYVNDLLIRPLENGGCVRTEFVKNCYEASDLAVQKCLEEIDDILTWEVESGIYRFQRDMEAACYGLSRARGKPGRAVTNPSGGS